MIGSNGEPEPARATDSPHVPQSAIVDNKFACYNNKWVPWTAEVGLFSRLGFSSPTFPSPK